MERPQKLSAIIVCTEPQVNGAKFLKYRNVDGRERPLGKFLAFAAKFPNASHVNLYCKKTRKFVERIYLQ